MPVRPLICLLLLLLADAGADARFKAIEKEWGEIRKSASWDDVKARRDLVNELATLDHPGAEALLHRIFVEDREQVCRIPAMLGLGARGGTGALKAMTAEAIRDRNEVYRMCLPLAFARSTNAEIGPWLLKAVLPRTQDRVVVAAVIESLGHLRCAEAYDPLAKLLAREPQDLRIAYECLIALARIGRARAVGTLLPYLDHESAVLREGALVALAETRHPGAIEVVPKMVADPDTRVREALAELILALRSDDGIPALIELLRSGRLRLMETARRVLAELSREDFGHDADAWERWFGRKETGKLPPKEWKGGGSSVATYYGMRIYSDRVLFVLDVSGSMEANVAGRPRDDDPRRIDIARRELAKTLDQLDSRTMFNVVGFSAMPRWWQDREVRATRKNVEAAKDFVESLPVGGGTNVYDTLEQALAKNRLVDTIYFLGDGSPSLGTYIEQEEILARIRWMNRFRKIRIHTIALLRGEVPMVGFIAPRLHDEDEAARFLRRLAEDHGGEFARVDE